MATLKCDICGKEFSGHDDKEMFIVCEDCKNKGIVSNTIQELSNGKGEDENE